jgi:hypothetical protein
MMRRCFDPKNHAYENYGGRGITVCERWKNDVSAFIADMGPRPSPKHSIDRKDNDGNYEPGNCRWATAREQRRNQRTNRKLLAFGEELNLCEWAERFGIPTQTINGRLQRGWPAELAVSSPRSRASLKARLEVFT